MEDKLVIDLGVDGVKGVSGDYFAHMGWETNALDGFWSYAHSYRDGANCLYDSMSAENSINIDRLIYPFCFLHRHCMELYLKSLSVYYYLPDHQQGKLNHKLTELWNLIKDTIIEKANKASIKIDFEDISSIIDEMSSFDNLSMQTRYPVDNQLNLYNNAPKNLDYRSFHKRMQLFYDSIETLVRTLNNTIEEEYPDPEKKQFFCCYRETHKKLEEFLDVLGKEMTGNEFLGELSIDPILYNKEKNERTDYILSLNKEEKIVFETLYRVASERLSLPSNPQDKKGKFLDGCIDFLKQKKQTFEKECIDEHLGIFNKKANILHRFMEEAMSILDEKE